MCALAISTLTGTKGPLDEGIAAVTAAQHGVISLKQLVELGLSPSGVRSRVARGALHRVHYGVYAVGHPEISQRGRWMAATLACGDGSLLSHLSAAHLATLTFWSRGIEVAAPGRRGRRRPGLTVYEASDLRARDWRTIDGIPCTGWASILVDLAASQPRRVVEKALDRTETLRIFDLPELEEAIEIAGSQGGEKLKRILSEYEIGSGETESVREDDFLELCERFDVPRPRCNFWMEIAGRWVRHDFWWPRERVSVEVDGYGTHGTRQGFRSDRKRDRNLILNTDISLLRFDASEVRQAQAEVARDVLAMLQKRR
jgi:hypothetical protein